VHLEVTLIYIYIYIYIYNPKPLSKIDFKFYGSQNGVEGKTSSSLEKVQIKTKELREKLQ